MATIGQFKTRSILGHSLSFVVGGRHLAQRPMLTTSDKRCNVSITNITDSPNGPLVAMLEDIDRNEADAFLAEFNNGDSSFKGRVWE